jgi:hypothetical protein
VLDDALSSKRKPRLARAVRHATGVDLIFTIPSGRRLPTFAVSRRDRDVPLPVVRAHRRLTASQL